MRTLHIAQIYGVIQKQLVCLRAVSTQYGRVFAFSLPELRGREYRKIFTEMQLRLKLNVICIIYCFLGTTEAIFYVRNVGKLDTSVL